MASTGSLNKGEVVDTAEEKWVSTARLEENTAPRMMLPTELRSKSPAMSSAASVSSIPS